MASFREDRSICGCANAHGIRRVVLTGGPGAGKTAVLELVKKSFCQHVMVLPEAAGIVFGGGFPRRSDILSAQSAQRAIFYVQRELENAAEGQNPAVILCDRGTVDGGAYWMGKPDLWTSVGTTLPTQLSRYSAVIHMRVPPAAIGYNHSNPLRLESPEEAAKIDRRIAELWARHPNVHSIDPQETFIEKAAKVLEVLKQQVPECCRHHVIPLEQTA
ncbi:MAG TPA: ATP-binding protein [Gemmatimonadaceae bacterium]|nr:ATP-binding protein [Gemmatimonadaceae bacterium]